jgi:hypothetical protein
MAVQSLQFGEKATFLPLNRFCTFVKINLAFLCWIYSGVSPMFHESMHLSVPLAIPLSLDCCSYILNLNQVD